MQSTKRYRAAALAISLALLATACGSSGADQASTETSSPVSIDASSEVSVSESDGGIEELLLQSDALIGSDPTLSLLLALEANRQSPGATTEEAILESLASSGLTVSSPMDVAPPDAQGCGFPIASEDGSQIYQNVDGRLLRYDLGAGDVVDHGVAPNPCGDWLGDPEVNRMAFWDGQRGKWLLGDLGGSLDQEIVYDGDIGIFGRSMAGDRITFVAFGPSGMTGLVIDTTTGQVITEVANINSPASSTFGGDGTQLGFTTSVPGAGGQLIVLDAESGAEVSRVDLVESGEESRFDLATGEVVIPTAGGRLLTVDLESGEVIADVATAGTSEVNAVGIRPDGLVVISRQDMVEIVDRRTGPTGISAPLTDTVAIRISPEGNVVRVDTMSRIEVINVDGNGLAGLTDAERLARACDIAGRDLTQAEWDEYVSDGGTPQSACP